MDKVHLLIGGLSAIGIHQILPQAQEWTAWLINQAMSLAGGILCSVITAYLQRRWDKKKK